MAGTSEHTSDMAQSPNLADSLERARGYASIQEDLQLRIGHLLLAFLDDPDLDHVFSTLDRNSLSDEIAAHVTRVGASDEDLVDRDGGGGDTAGDDGSANPLEQLLDRAAGAAAARGQTSFGAPAVLEALFAGGDAALVEILTRHGIAPDTTIVESPAALGDIEEETLAEPIVSGWEDAPDMMDAPWPTSVPAEAPAPAPAPAGRGGGSNLEQPAAKAAPWDDDEFDFGRAATPMEAQQERSMGKRGKRDEDQPTGANLAVPKSAHEPVRAGVMAENVPRTMRVDVPVRVEARIGPGGSVSLEDMDGAIQQHALTITRAMSVRLVAPRGGFVIEHASPETQWVEPQSPQGLDHARWSWTVTATERGRLPLQIVVSARTVSPDGITAESPLPDQRVEVTVRANLGKSARRAGGWLVATLIGGILGAFSEEVFDFVSRWGP